jgi:hypothetical protein
MDCQATIAAPKTLCESQQQISPHSIEDPRENQQTAEADYCQPTPTED